MWVKSFLTSAVSSPGGLTTFYLFGFSLQHLGHPLRAILNMSGELEWMWKGRTCHSGSGSLRACRAHASHELPGGRSTRSAADGLPRRCKGQRGVPSTRTVQMGDFFPPTPLRREMCFSVWVLHLGSVSLDWTGGEASFHRWWSGCVRWTFASLFPFFKT